MEGLIQVDSPPSMRSSFQLFPGLSEADPDDAIEAVRDVLGEFLR